MCVCSNAVLRNINLKYFSYRGEKFVIIGELESHLVHYTVPRENNLKAEINI